MQSQNLQTHGFGNWLQLDVSNAPQLIASLSKDPGVFVVRSKKMLARARGTSDIVFIGVGANQSGGIRKRIEQVFSPGPTQSTNHRLLDAISTSSDYELAVVVCPTAQAANNLKRRLLDEYNRDHSDLPPLSLRK
jgi:hypothetical protein